MRLPPIEMSAGSDLIIRLLDEPDAGSLHRAIGESRDHLTPFLPFVTNDPPDLDFRRAWIGRCRESFFAGESFHYGILRSSGVIGGCSIDPIDELTASIGFWVHTDHVRQGIARSVAASLTEAAFGVGFEVVRIRHDRANAASGAIAASLGYDCAGEEPHSIDAPGQTGTSLVWTLRRVA